MAEQLAELQIVRTSDACLSYRLIVAGRTVWSNRAFADVPESHTACRARARTWALKNGYWIVERPESERRRRA